MAERKAKWQNDYIARTYDRINLTVPKGQKEIIQAHAETQGESVNGFIGRAILEAMERDGGGIPSEIAGKPAEAAQGVRAVSLPSETLEAAQEAAEAAGQTVPDFVETQVERGKG